jgi:hypothetical protein
MNTIEKNILTSKVFWVAILQGILGVVVVVSTSIPGVGWLMILKTIIDIALRMLTTQPVSI